MANHPRLRSTILHACTHSSRGSPRNVPNTIGDTGSSIVMFRTAGLGAVLAAAISASLAARVLAASAPSSPPLTYTSSNSHAFEKVAVLSQFGVLPVG